MKKLIALVPTTGKTKKQITDEAIAQLKLMGYFKKQTRPEPRVRADEEWVATP